MATMDNIELESLNRRELQKLCKEHGIKANRKTVELIASLRGLGSLRKSDHGVASESSPSQPKTVETEELKENVIETGVVVSPASKKSPKKKRNKRGNDVHLKEVPTSVPVTESEVTQRRDGPIVSDLPKESVEKDADTQSSHVMDQLQNMDVSHVVNQPQNMDLASSHFVDQPQNMDLPSSDGGDQLERIDLPSLDDDNVVTSRKRTRRSTFDVPQTLSKSSHIMLPEVSSGEGVAKKSRDPESAPPSKKMKHGTHEADQDTSNIEKTAVESEQKAPVQDDMREELLRYLDTKVAERRNDGDSLQRKPLQHFNKPSKIPVGKNSSKKDWDKIHNRAFERMESLSEYVKRRQQRLNKTPINRPVHKPSISLGKSQVDSSSDFSTNVGSKITVNTPRDFNLKASLKKKLPYKPYTGPLPKAGR